MALYNENILNNEIKVILDDGKDNNGNLLPEIAFLWSKSAQKYFYIPKI